MRVPLVLLLLAACGTRAPAKRPAAAVAVRDTAPPDTTPPVAVPGVLVTRAVQEPGALDGRWLPRAGVCPGAPSFQLLAQTDSVDVLVLLQLPGDSVAPGTYAVTPADTAPPRARTARIGVQQMRYADLGYQATSGTVRIERLDRLATGRFDVTLQEMPSHRTLRYLGAFAAIPVDTLDAAACRAAAPDSASPAARRKPA